MRRGSAVEAPTGRWVARGIVVAIFVGALPMAAPGAAPLAAQQSRAAPGEPRMLADAQRREAAGDFAGAEEVLRDLLEQFPTSTGGLFALERILRGQGRVVEVLPSLDRFLRLEPGAAGARLLQLRILVEVDSVAEARSQADAWIEVDPTSPDPYREAAALFEDAVGPAEALALLREGTDALGNALLAVETGDLLLRMGDAGEAVREWSRALGDEAAQLPAVLQRIGGMSSREQHDIHPLVEALGREPTTPARKRAAAQIAVELGLEDEAVELARAVIPEMPESARRGFLVGLARQAEAGGLDRMTLWVYRTLREDPADAGEGLALDRQIVALAVAEGDTALALAAQERLATALPDASTEQRRAAASSIRLSVALRPPEEVQRRLDAFRNDFPDAPELDELAMSLAGLWSSRGDQEAAKRVLQGVEGPMSALQRAFLALEEGRPDAERVKADLRLAANGLPGTMATEVIQLLALMNRLGEDAALVGGRAAALAHRGEIVEAVGLLDERVHRLPRDDRPPLLALGARLISGAGDPQGLADEKAAFLVRLVDDFADAPEAPEAMLALARHRARSGAGVDEATDLLERLILTRPDSPVVPDARRELQRLRQRGTGGGGAGR